MRRKFKKKNSLERLRNCVAIYKRLLKAIGTLEQAPVQFWSAVSKSRTGNRETRGECLEVFFYQDVVERMPSERFSGPLKDKLKQFNGALLS